MDNTDYSSIWNTNAYSLRNTYWWYGWSSTIYDQTTASVMILVTNQFSNITVDAIENSIQVFWWKSY